MVHWRTNAPVSLQLASVQHTYCYPVQAWRTCGLMRTSAGHSYASDGLTEVFSCTCMRRHGARTPLTDRYWEGATWQTGPDCGQQYEAVRIAVRDLRGGMQPASAHDASQVRQYRLSPTHLHARLLVRTLHAAAAPGARLAAKPGGAWGLSIRRRPCCRAAAPRAS